MRPIAQRGDVVAWAPDDFDPATGEVELRQPGKKPVKVVWQQALKFGYWEPFGERDAD